MKIGRIIICHLQNYIEPVRQYYLGSRTDFLVIAYNKTSVDPSKFSESENFKFFGYEGKGPGGHLMGLQWRVWGEVAAAYPQIEAWVAHDYDVLCKPSDRDIFSHIGEGEVGFIGRPQPVWQPGMTEQNSDNFPFDKDYHYLKKKKLGADQMALMSKVEEVLVADFPVVFEGQKTMMGGYGDFCATTSKNFCLLDNPATRQIPLMGVEQVPHTIFTYLGLKLVDLRQFYSLKISYDPTLFVDFKNEFDISHPVKFWPQVEKVNWKRRAKRFFKSFTHPLTGISYPPAKKKIPKWVLFSMACLSVFFMLGAVELVLRALPTSFFSIFRPTDYLLGNNFDFNFRVYKPNTTKTFHIKNGDLRNIDKEADIEIEPHDATWQIDSLGFRNNRDYKPGDYVLLGDSFIEGAQNDQKDILANQLAGLGVNAYSLAFPGDLSEYSRYMNAFEPRLKDSKVVAFFFEGNDFPDGELNPVNYSRTLEFEKKVGRVLKDFMVSKVVLYNYYNFRDRRLGRPPHQVASIKIKGHKVGFFKSDIYMAEREVYIGSGSFESQMKDIAPKLDYVVFIPTSYRVYYDLFDEKAGKPLPNAQYGYLKSLVEKNNLPFLDLTPFLQKAAKEKLASGEFLWWKDDTHWGKNGIAAAAAALKEQIFDNPSF